MDKNVAKKYLLSVVLLLTAGYTVSFLILYAASHIFQQTALYSLIPTVIVTGTYTGFVSFGLKLIEKGRLSKGVIIAVCIFFPVTLAIITVSGIILIIPETFKAIIKLIRG